MKRLPERDELWMAYLDGEMSAMEAAAFDATLNDSERAAAEMEIRVETALGARISAPVPCPGDVWADLKAKVGARAPRHRRWYDGGWRVAAAALFAVGAWGSMLSINYPKLFRARPQTPFVMQADTMLDLVSYASVNGDVSSVQQFLDAHHLDLSIHESTRRIFRPGMETRLRGAGIETFDDVDVPVIYFECCRQPVKVVLMHASHGGSCHKKQLDICGSKAVGQFEIIAVSRHRHAERVLELFDEKARQASEDTAHLWRVARADM